MSLIMLTDSMILSRLGMNLTKPVIRTKTSLDLTFISPDKHVSATLRPQYTTKP